VLLLIVKKLRRLTNAFESNFYGKGKTAFGRRASPDRQTSEAHHAFESFSTVRERRPSAVVLLLIVKKLRRLTNAFESNFYGKGKTAFGRHASPDRQTSEAHHAFESFSTVQERRPSAVVLLLIVKLRRLFTPFE
jgi:hypothetical protein